jgi:hypothetical protein
MQNAYGEFMEHLKTVGGSDNATALRTLTITRIELSALETAFQYEQGGKCPEKILSAKSTILY